MNKALVLLIIGIACSCNIKDNVKEPETKKHQELLSKEGASDKIKVLNFAIFHMAGTTDSKSIKFDEKNEKNQEDALQIAKLVSEFKPTVICVELPPSANNELNKEYNKFCLLYTSPSPRD